MNSEVMQSRWNQLRSEAQHRWNRLSDEDLVNTRQAAQQQVDRLAQQYSSGMANLQKTAGSWFDTSRDFLADNPWTAIVAAVLLIGVIAGILARPNMRNY